ncbi:MAG: glycosyltransferase family 39 protein [Candidatus Sulfotelmatobacter sp.]
MSRNPPRRSQVAQLRSTKPEITKLEVARCEVAKTTSQSPGISPRWCVVLLAMVILFFSLIRIRLLNFPLERDEGEYAYSGQLMLQGIVPYSLAYNMKLPGTYAAYALIMAAFGESPAGIHAGLLLTNAATVILLFLLAKKLFGPLAGLAAGSSYALLSTSESVLGLAGHATHFVVLPALTGILILLHAIESKRIVLYFLSGFLLGLAFLCKQPGLFFVLFGALFLSAMEWRVERDWHGLARRLGIYSVGAIILFALTCVVLLFAGALGKMWFWTFSYGTQYASALTFSEGWQQFSETASSVVESAAFVWILAAIGLAALAWDSRTWRHAAFTIGFLLFSWAAVCPGFYFRQHYFILVLPAVCLFIGIAVSSAAHELSQYLPSAAATAIPLLILLSAIAFSVAGQSDIFFRFSPLTACRAVYGNNPFPEAQVISEYLNQHSSPNARIAVIGSEPEVYFYSRRHSATGHIYTYPLVEPQKYAMDMQKDMAREIENSRPEYMVFVQVISSWIASPESSTFILDWSHKYAADHYEMVGIVDETDPQTQYVWGDSAKSYHVKSDASIGVFKRKLD